MRLMRNMVIFLYKRPSQWLLAMGILLLWVRGIDAQTITTPKLDLKVRHVRSEHNFSGWRFEVINYDQQPVALSDLEVRFWVHGKSAVATKTWVSGSLEDGKKVSLGVISGLTANVDHLKRYKVYPANEKAEWVVRLKAQNSLSIPAGGRWKDAYFEYYLKNWGPIEAEQSYSQSPQIGNGKDYFENPTVGLYYQGTLVAEWESAGESDGQTGQEPLAPLNIPTVETNPVIASPADGEQVCGIVQIALQPQGNNWELEWSPDGTNWQPITAQETGSYWSASWDASGLKAGNYQLRLINDLSNATLQQITIKVGAPQFAQDFVLPNKGIPGGLGWNGTNLSVLDYQNQLVQVLSSTGTTQQTLGSYGTRSGELNQAFDLAVDNSGQLYVADTGNNRVQILSPVSGLLGESIISNPIAVKAYKAGLFVLDGSTIHLFDTNGNYLYSGWLGLSGQYADVAVDDTGLVYILNGKTRSIDVYGPDFVKEASWTGPFGTWNPTAIYYSNGRLWVSDAQANQVLKLGLNGNCLASWGGYGLAPGQFDQPGKIVADANGNVYVSDMGNNRVEKFVLQTAANAAAAVTASPTVAGALAISGLNASPSALNPAQGQVTLTYTLSQAAQVQESVQDSSGNVILKQLYTASDFGGQNGLNRVYWSAMLDGSPVSGGSYTISLLATANGQQSQAQAVVYVVGLNTPVPTFVNTSTATSTSTSSGALPTVVYTATSTQTTVIPSATGTVVPPTATNTEPPVPSATATYTSVLATDTPIVPTATGTIVPPTATYTSVPATDTPIVPPTFTATTVATSTSVAATFTSTSVPIATNTSTPIPPTATYTFTKTPMPPTATFTPAACGTPIAINVEPYLQCVKSLGNGTYSAYFGYTNNSVDACGNHVTVTIPWGSQNDINPNLAGTPPIYFAPGSQTAFIALIQSGQTISWTLNGTTVTANAHSPLCH